MTTMNVSGKEFMNAAIYYKYIEEKLNLLSLRVGRSGKLNLLDINSHSEDFYERFLNLVYGWNLVNLNRKHHNVEGIDLEDKVNKLVVQVSATCTKEKIEKSLGKKKLSEYQGYTFKFIHISDKDSDDLRKKTYLNPYGLCFEASIDIIDVTSLLRDLKSKDAESLVKIYQFVKSELGGDVDIAKLESNLATIINILSKEDLENTENPNVNSFEIDRKISFNKLHSAKPLVKDYIAHHAIVDKIYNEFDLQGKNKSASVLANIRGIYLKNKANKTDDELFFLIIEQITNFVTNSSNYSTIPIDELSLCATILTVDAFIRCKIFKNPVKYDYATT